MRLFSQKKPFFTKDQFSGEQFSIGDFTYGSPDVISYDNKTKLTVGKYCSFAAQVTILLGGDHRIDWATTYPFPDLPEQWPEADAIVGHPASKGDISIGSDVWIGYGATLLSGITIGDGAVVGANALVSSDIAPYGVAVGTPAAVIKTRFDKKTISRLLTLGWWNWSEEKVRQNIHLLCSANIEALLTAHDS